MWLTSPDQGPFDAGTAIFGIGQAARRSRERDGPWYFVTAFRCWRSTSKGVANPSR